MRDHVLLQAIARVNRPYEDEEGRQKKSGFVLDFVGIFDKLEKALAFDSKDIEGVIEGLDILRERFESLVRVGREKYLPIMADKKGDKQVEAVLEHFREKEQRDEFYQYFRELQDIYEILSPDSFLRPFLDDYNELLRMFHLLRANYERGKSVDREFLRKTAKLVQEHTHAGRIESPEKVYALDSGTLDKIAAQSQSDTVKVFNLLKALHVLVDEKAQGEPYLISIGDRAEAIAESFEQRQMTTQQALEALERLIAELREAERSRDETGLSPEAFAVYYVLKRDGVADPQKVAEQADTAFKQYPHWQTSSEHERHVRSSLYKSLIDGGVEAVVDVGTTLMKLLRRASS